MQSVLVTGASTGIGYASVEVLTAHGARVYAGVRKPADAERLRAAFGERVRPLLLDVTDPAHVAEAAAVVRRDLAGERLFGLVNNAGIAIAGPLLHQPLEELEQVFRINVTGVVRMVQAFAPLLGSDPALSGPPGRIVQMSSVAGRIAIPFLGAYAGSKHALEGLSDCLRAELQLFGIDVIVIGPGSVATPIWDKAEQVDYSRYQGTPFATAMAALSGLMLAQGRRGYPARVIGEAVWKALTMRRPPARMAPVQGRLLNWVVPRMLPRRWVEWGVGRKLGLVK